MVRLLVAAAALTLTLASAPAAHAQNVLFSVPGVVNADSLGTYFSCTNVGTAAATVIVTVFSNIGVAAGSASLSVTPKGTVMFGTAVAAGLTIDVSLGAGAISAGSGQILSTSKSLVCAAFLADTVGAPPVSMTTLPVISKTKQKGD